MGRVAVREGMPRTTLRARSLAAVAWSGLDLVLRQGIQFGVSVALARLLTPNDFGTIALLYLFVGIAGLFVDTGFSMALIQQPEITKEDESSVFWFNVCAGAVVAVALGVASRPIAAFYRIPVLVPLTYVMAVNLFVTTLSSVHFTLMTRALDFKTQAKIGLAASLVSGAVAVIMAWRGAGVWALATQVLLSTVVTTALAWGLHNWRPMLRFSLASLRRLFRFSAYLFIYFSLDTIYSKLYTIVIGKLYSARELGLYSRADGTAKMPMALMTGVVQRASFPIFASVSGDKEMLRRGLRKAIIGLSWLNVPATVGLLVTARPLVLTLFGDQWVGSIGPLRVLCIANILVPVQTLNSKVLMAQGHSGLFLKAEVIVRVIGIVAVVAAIPFGIMAIAWSMVLCSLVDFVVKAHYSKVLLGYSALQQARDLAPVGIVSVGMAVVVLLVPVIVATSNSRLLVSQVLTGIGVYVACSYVFKLEAFSDVKMWGSELLGRLMGGGA